MLRGWGHDSKIVPFLSFRTATNSKKHLIEFSAEVPARNAEHKAGMLDAYWCLHQNNLFFGWGFSDATTAETEASEAVHELEPMDPIDVVPMLCKMMMLIMFLSFAKAAGRKGANVDDLTTFISTASATQAKDREGWTCPMQSMVKTTFPKCQWRRCVVPVPGCPPLSCVERSGPQFSPLAAGVFAVLESRGSFKVEQLQLLLKLYRTLRLKTIAA